VGSFSDKLAAALGRRPTVIPALLKNYSLTQLIAWYEANLAAIDVLDPRGHQVVFDLSRFAYLIKLTNLDGTKLSKPLQVVEKIKAGELSDKDFRPPDLDRAERLSWLPITVSEPLSIRKNDSRSIPATDVYTKQFAQSGYLRFKLLYCMRMGESLLVPVTSFRRHREPQGELLWTK
jgi:hypothetical protein